SVTGRAQAFVSKNVLGTNGSTLQVTGDTVNDGNSGGNYSVTLHTATGTITKAALDIYAVTDPKIYDGTTTSSATPTFNNSQLKGTDTLSGLAQAFQSPFVLGTNGSTLRVTANNVNDGNSSLNYGVTLHTAGGTIYPAATSVSASGGPAIFGDASVTLNAT